MRVKWINVRGKTPFEYCLNFLDTDYGIVKCSLSQKCYFQKEIPFTFEEQTTKVPSRGYLVAWIRASLKLKL